MANIGSDRSGGVTPPPVYDGVRQGISTGDARSPTQVGISQKTAFQSDPPPNAPFIALDERLGALTVVSTATVEDHLFLINDPFGSLTLTATTKVKVSGTTSRTLGSLSLAATGTVATPAAPTAGQTGGTPSRKAKRKALQSQYKKIAGELPDSLTQPTTQGIAIRSGFGGNRISLQDFQGKLDTAKANILAHEEQAALQADDDESEEMLVNLLAHIL